MAVLLEHVIIYLLLLLVYLHAAESKRTFTIDISHCNFTHHNPRLLRKIECNVGRDSRGLSQLYGEFVLAQNISAFSLHSTFDMLRKDDTKINLMNLQMSGCKFLEAYYGIAGVQILLHELHRVSNLARKCPVPAGVRYYANNFTVNPEDFPPFTPIMSWILKVEYWIKDKLQGDLVISGRVRRVK